MQFIIFLFFQQRSHTVSHSTGKVNSIVVLMRKTELQCYCTMRIMSSIIVKNNKETVLCFIDSLYTFVTFDKNDLEKDRKHIN